MSAFVKGITGSCERYDHPLRYLVKASSLEGSVYLVDLGDFDGNGSCTCRDFEIRRKKRLKEGAKRGPATQCKHIATARKTFCDDMIAAVKEEEAKRNEFSIANRRRVRA